MRVRGRVCVRRAIHNIVRHQLPILKSLKYFSLIEMTCEPKLFSYQTSFVYPLDITIPICSFISSAADGHDRRSMLTK